MSAVRRAIDAATSLTNPRLSEVDWDAVDAAYRAELAAKVRALPADEKADGIWRLVRRADVLALIEAES